jgi:hypothetical protein
MPIDTARLRDALAATAADHGPGLVGPDNPFVAAALA